MPEPTQVVDPAPAPVADPTGTAPQPATTPAPVAEDANAATLRENKALRAEQTKRRLHEQELETELQKIRDAQKSEADKAAERVKALETFEQQAKPQIKDLSLRLTVERTARQLGIIDEEAAWALIDRKPIVFDSDGVPDPATVKATLETLVASKPWLKAPPAPPMAPQTQATNPAASRSTKLTNETLKQMSTDEVNSRWVEIQEYLKSGK
jgi:hypothetical protein